MENLEKSVDTVDGGASVIIFKNNHKISTKYSDYFSEKSMAKHKDTCLKNRKKRKNKKV